MYNFPKNLYTDVRIEDIYETRITYRLGDLEESKNRNYKAAFIRLFDGKRWYFASTSSVENIQSEINKLAGYAKSNDEILNHPAVIKLKTNAEKLLKYVENSVSTIDVQKKHGLLKQYFPLIKENKYIKNWRANYVDKRIVKEFYSSKGSEVIFDSQLAGFSIGMDLMDGDRRFSDSFQRTFDDFEKLEGKLVEYKGFVAKCEDFLKRSEPVRPGKYTVILSPQAAGVFAHESFGHKSEADFMVGDETMKKEWAIGKKVAADILSIVDYGNIPGSGYVPFDDEGTKAEETYLVKNGILSGRLHSSVTAASLDENLTGNSRAMNFEYEPIVRMTTTYISPGTKTKEQLIEEIKDGILLETIKHGSGMSTFTIAPSMAYYIRDGKIAEPVNISVVSGNVMETLKEIDGLSDNLEILAFILGGCGKNEQYPLSVGFGGPYVRVNNLNVQ
jgi:TldD protein